MILSALNRCVSELQLPIADVKPAFMFASDFREMRDLGETETLVQTHALVIGQRNSRNEDVRVSSRHVVYQVRVKRRANALPVIFPPDIDRCLGRNR